MLWDDGEGESLGRVEVLVDAEVWRSAALKCLVAAKSVHVLERYHGRGSHVCQCAIHDGSFRQCVNPAFFISLATPPKAAMPILPPTQPSQRSAHRRHPQSVPTASNQEPLVLKCRPMMLSDFNKPSIYIATSIQKWMLVNVSPLESAVADY